MVKRGSPANDARRYLVVISADALSEDNWPTFSELPNVSRLLREGAYSSELKSIFPTLTYAVHATMVTGNYPARHGVLHNHPFQPLVPEKDQAWYWYRDSIKTTTIYDAAKSHGLTTAALLWPVTGRSVIDYNLPEIVALKNENQALKIMRAGSVLYCLDLELRFRKIRRGISQPALDNFVLASATYTIKKHRPSLMLVHFTDLDDKKHRYGVTSPEVAEALERLDWRIGEIIAATKAAGIHDQTTFLVVGDHGQFDVHYLVRLNALFRKEGLIFGSGSSLDWRAYLQCSGGSAYLLVREGDDEALTLSLKILQEAMAAQEYGIESICPMSITEHLPPGTKITHAVYARPGYYLNEAWDGAVLETFSSPGVQYAAHGYAPETPGYNCVLIAKGPGVTARGSLGPLEMVDIAPTMAKILKVQFPPCAGKAIPGIN